MARRAINSYAAQNYEPRELVIVCDGHEHYAALRDYAHAVCRSRIAVTSVASGSVPLGALRNRAIELAAGDIVCQWDDDDLSHPQRLSVQLDHMRVTGAGACLLTDHLHLMLSDRSLYWCDWTTARGRAPISFGMPSTLMCERRAAVGGYPESGPVSRRSEDASFVRSLVKRCTVAKLGGSGWLYLYVFHGTNTWDESHHRRIVRAMGKDASELLRHQGTLAEAAAVYGLGSDVTVRDYQDVPVFVLPALDGHCSEGRGMSREWAAFG